MHRAAVLGSCHSSTKLDDHIECAPLSYLLVWTATRVPESTAPDQCPSCAPWHRRGSTRETEIWPSLQHYWRYRGEGEEERRKGRENGREKKGEREARSKRDKGEQEREERKNEEIMEGGEGEEAENAHIWRVRSAKQMHIKGDCQQQLLVGYE